MKDDPKKKKSFRITWTQAEMDWFDQKRRPGESRVECFKRMLQIATTHQANMILHGRCP